MKGMNKVQLIGNLGMDPETRFTPEGKQVTKFRMAVNRTFKTGRGKVLKIPSGSTLKPGLDWPK